MPTVSLLAMNGRRLTLQRLSEPDGESIWTYRATLVLPEGEMTSVVWDHGASIAVYFRELADAWRGFDDGKSYSSLEGQLAIEARHDGLGTVTCEVQLAQMSPPEWAITAVLDFGAGANLATLANELAELVA